MPTVFTLVICLVVFQGKTILPEPSGNYLTLLVIKIDWAQSNVLGAHYERLVWLVAISSPSSWIQTGTRNMAGQSSVLYHLGPR